MVFSSTSTDLDPSNLQEPQYQQEGFISWYTDLHNGNNINPTNSNVPLLLPPQPPPPTTGHMDGPGPKTRPISMAVKCPRCESNNTKFCYYNNRSLSQPRHWCRSCRRHWTQGGALRTVPIGGARRKNKRSKCSTSSSGASSAATPAPVLGLTDYYDSAEAEQSRTMVLPPRFPFELEAELSSFEVGRVIGSMELEEIGQVGDEFGSAYFN